MMTWKTLTLDRRDGVATLTLNRPDAYNALNLELGRELFHAVLELDDDPAVRCVVITGAGKAFCAGGDVKDFADNLPRIGALVKELTTYLHGAVSRLCRSDKPVITAVNGVAAGGGFSFALCGDLVVAAESARFTMAYTKIGLSPDGTTLAIVCAGGYLIYAAPQILPEAAWQATLATGLARVSKPTEHENWLQCVVRKSSIPFAVVLILVVVLATVAHRHCPSAVKLTQALHCPVPIPAE